MAFSTYFATARKVDRHFLLVTPLTGRTYAIEGALDLLDPETCLAPARDRMLLAQTCPMPDQAAQRIPQQADIRRPVHRGLCHR